MKPKKTKNDEQAEPTVPTSQHGIFKHKKPVRSNSSCQLEYLSKYSFKDQGRDPGPAC